jgi:hypothetical protein
MGQRPRKGSNTVLPLVALVWRSEPAQVRQINLHREGKGSRLNRFRTTYGGLLSRYRFYRDVRRKRSQNRAVVWEALTSPFHSIRVRERVKGCHKKPRKTGVLSTSGWKN